MTLVVMSGIPTAKSYIEVFKKRPVLYGRQNVQIRGRRKMWARGGIKISSLSEVRLKVIISCDVELKVNISCDVELKVTISCDVGHKVKISRDAALKIGVKRTCARCARK